MKKNKIAVTIGDPSGIGPEIVLKALVDNPNLYELCTPIVFGHKAILEYYSRQINVTTEIVDIKPPFDVYNPDPGKIYCYANDNCIDIPPVGKINAKAGRLAFEYLESAIDAILDNQLVALATAPINKEAMRLAGIPYLDHTEILTKLTNSRNTMTLFITGSLRIFFLTRHIAFRDISSKLNKEEIIKHLHYSAEYLQQIKIVQPRLALAALNPHAGESGMFGNEEIDVLKPAVDQARKEGLDVQGPIAADSVFQLTKEGVFDAVLSLYHDQGHIAAKTYDFYRTISLTMGLPFLRTSVDHGTAMEIAGQNRANAISMTEAIKAAAQYSW